MDVAEIQVTCAPEMHAAETCVEGRVAAGSSLLTTGDDGVRRVTRDVFRAVARPHVHLTAAACDALGTINLRGRTDYMLRDAELDAASQVMWATLEAPHQNVGVACSLSTTVYKHDLCGTTNAALCATADEALRGTASVVRLFRLPAGTPCPAVLDIVATDDGGPGGPGARICLVEAARVKVVSGVVPCDGTVCVPAIGGTVAAHPGGALHVIPDTGPVASADPVASAGPVVLACPVASADPVASAGPEALAGLASLSDVLQWEPYGVCTRARNAGPPEWLRRLGDACVAALDCVICECADVETVSLAIDLWNGTDYSDDKVTDDGTDYMDGKGKGAGEGEGGVRRRTAALRALLDAELDGGDVDVYDAEVYLDALKALAGAASGCSDRATDEPV